MGIGTCRKLNLALIQTNNVRRRLRAAEAVGQSINNLCFSFASCRTTLVILGAIRP